MISLLASICLGQTFVNPGTKFTGGIGIQYFCSVKSRDHSGLTEDCAPNLILTTRDGRTLILDLPPKLLASYGDLKPLIGRWVEATGQLSFRGKEILSVKKLSPFPDYMTPKGVQQGEPKPITKKTATSKPYVLLPVKFADEMSEPLSQAELTTLMGNTKPGMDHYYREQSYGAINMAGTVVKNWRILPQPRSYYIQSGARGMDTEKLVADAISLFDADVDFTQFYGIHVYMNKQTGDFGGLGGMVWHTLEGVSRPWAQTLINPFDAAHSVYAHECGHSLGFDHSSGPYSETYDSGWDDMSRNSRGVLFPPFGGLSTHTNAYHREKVGWLPKSRVFLALPGTNQTITIDRLATSSVGYQSIRIYPDVDGRHYITAEARRYGGEYDIANVLPGEAVVLHDVVEGRQVMDPYFNVLTVDRNSQVIDPDNNGDPNDAGAMWTVGETYTGINGITIQVTGSTASSYTVKVVVPGAIPSPLTVRTTADSGPGSLRSALYFSNYLGTGNLDFKIPASDPGFVAGTAVIKPLSPFPYMDVAGITIDGASQTSLGGNTNPSGPEVYIDGTSAGDYTDAIVCVASNLTIKNIGLGNFKLRGIYADGAPNLKVENCFIGVTPDGLNAAGCHEAIILANGTNGAIIGGVGKGNVLSGNVGPGIYVNRSDNLTIRGNRIGTNPAGTAAVSNLEGMIIGESKNLVIDQNLISGNRSYAAYISNCDGGTFTGNFVGTDAIGSNPLANLFGVNLNTGTKNFTLGGTTSAARNLLSGNTYTATIISATADCSVLGNYIGTNLAGNGLIRNGDAGIVVTDGAVRTKIGNGIASGRNIISGCGNAVYCTGATTSGIDFNGNYVGTNAAGTTAIANLGVGISFLGVVDSIIQNSVISGSGWGVSLMGARCTLTNSYIGLGSDGETAIGNKGLGVTIANGASNNLVDRNWITNNIGGIYVYKGTGATVNNRIERNVIGATLSGVVAGTDWSGISLGDQSTSTKVGAPGKGNFIVGFTGPGIAMFGQTSNNVVQGNTIGVDEKGRDLNSGWAAIGAWGGAKDNLIGGDSDLGQGNTLGGCDRGLYITDEATDGISVRGNRFLRIGFMIIDLNANGADPNDNLDVDTGANETVNKPVLSLNTRYGGGWKFMQGTMSGRANQTFIIELYGSRGLLPNGQPAAEQPLARATVKTNAQGTATFSIPSPWVGSKITAIATEVSTGNTSEVSNAINVSGIR